MARYLFCLWDGGGCVPPLLDVAAAMVARGHAVRVLADPVLRPDVEASGAQFVAWTRAPHRDDRTPASEFIRDWEPRTPMGGLARIRDRLVTGPAADFATDVRDELARSPADVVVPELLLLGAAVGAEAAGVPVAVLSTTVHVVPTPGVPPFGPGFLPARGPLGRGRDRLFGALGAALWNRGLPALNAARAANGLGPLDDVFDQLRRADRTLVLSSAAFDFAAGHTSEAVVHCGPRINDPVWAEPWSAPPGDAPLVLVAMSSTNQDHAKTLGRVIEGLGRLPVRGLVTTGPELDPTLLDPPANVTVVRSAPHVAVLAHAAAAITHCGHGSASKALAAGVPQVCIPISRDQPDVAARVVAAGAGVRLRPWARPATVARALSKILDDPAYRRGAQRLAAALAHERVEDRAVAELEALTAIRGR
ncbi:nucleotide disphospho-sugar-binding domain-containing protein [Baekduia sp. Peel2402]|uniref:nucleotide disphospho-sugar-binding domain-containing protein n=1 Tax=Baekduia sp. Peel2402 TaxID=3458296 RepID=UPI00403EBE74